LPSIGNRWHFAISIRCHRCQDGRQPRDDASRYSAACRAAKAAGGSDFELVQAAMMLDNLKP
jgi:hypothetical protein